MAFTKKEVAVHAEDLKKFFDEPKKIRTHEVASLEQLYRRHPFFQAAKFLAQRPMASAIGLQQLAAISSNRTTLQVYFDNEFEGIDNLARIANKEESVFEKLKNEPAGKVLMPELKLPEQYKEEQEQNWLESALTPQRPFDADNQYKELLEGLFDPSTLNTTEVVELLKIEDIKELDPYSLEVMMVNNTDFPEVEQLVYEPETSSETQEQPTDLSDENTLTDQQVEVEQTQINEQPLADPHIVQELPVDQTVEQQHTIVQHLPTQKESPKSFFDQIPDDFLNNQQQQTEQQKATEKQSFFDQILADPAAEPRRKKKKPFRKINQMELIERFVQQKPRIKPELIEDKEQTDLAEEFTHFPTEYVSESLAKIVAQQGKKNLAINIYQQLILKYPEKSTYFASLIETLKES